MWTSAAGIKGIPSLRCHPYGYLSGSVGGWRTPEKYQNPWKVEIKLKRQNLKGKKNRIRSFRRGTKDIQLFRSRKTYLFAESSYVALCCVLHLSVEKTFPLQPSVEMFWRYIEGCFVFLLFSGLVCFYVQTENAHKKRWMKTHLLSVVAMNRTWSSGFCSRCKKTWIKLTLTFVMM